MKNRLMLVVLLMLTLPVAASAQFGLTEENIAELAFANQSSLASSQFTFDYTVELLIDGVPGSNVSVNLGGNGAYAPDNQLASLTLDGSATVEGAETPLSAELRIVGESIYVNAVDPTSGTETGWFELALNDLDVDPMSLSDEALGQVGINQEDLMPIIGALGSVDPTQFITVSRTEDGGGVAYTAVLSLADMFTSESTAPVVQAFADEAGPGVDADAIFEGAPAVLGASNLSASQRIDTASGVVSGATIAADVDIAGMADSPTSLDFTLNVNVGNYNQPVEVVAPDGATPLPADLIMSSLGLQQSETFTEELAPVEAETEAEPVEAAPSTEGASGDPLVSAADVQPSEINDFDATVSFPNGVTFSYPSSRYNVIAESDANATLQTLDMFGLQTVFELDQSLGQAGFNETFYMETYGVQAAAGYGVETSLDDFAAREFGGRTFQVLRFDATANDTYVMIVVVAYTGGGYTTLTAVHVTPPPPGFFSDMMALAISMDKAQ